jgi:serine/arginine repetitive matrix protein 2
MVALANLNLSLVHPSSKLDTRPQPQPQSQQDSPSFDSSMIALANINLSLIHPSSGSSLQPRQHLLSLESDTSSKRNARLAHVSPYANDRARARLPSLESDTSSKFHARSQPSARISPHIRNPSEVSAASFGYAQPNDHLSPIIDAPHTAMQANFPPPAFPVPAAPSPNHARNESMASIPSISSYGKVINPGVHNPFGYDYLLQHNSSYSMEMADTSAPMEGNSKSFGEQDKEKRRRKRMSTDSDKSSFYFRGNSMSRGHRRDDSIASFSANIPPISFHNTSFNRFHHKRSQSSESASSLAHAYGTYGANGGKAAWAMHRPDNSVDSILSDFSASRLGRPGIGDKMFDTAEQSYGAPLSAISASPSGSEMGRGDGLGARSSFDSILDDARSSFDSIFDRPANRASSVSSASIFGNDDPPPPGRKMLFPQAADQKFRPLSIISNTSHYSAPREDDTMVSMLGGEHVRRKSVGSSFEASPCFRAKRKHAVLQMRPGDTDDDADVDGSPNKARVVEKASVISKASVKFGAERMSRARRGRLERQSLEDSALSAEGEESTRACEFIVSACLLEIIAK